MSHIRSNLRGLSPVVRGNEVEFLPVETTSGFPVLPPDLLNVFPTDLIGKFSLS